MSKLSQLSNNEDSLDQASEWLAKVDRGLSPSEQLALQQWLDSNPMHRRNLFDMAALWDSMSILSELSEMFPLEEQAKPSKASWRYYSAIAASLMLLSLGIGLFWINQHLLLQDQYTTAIGEHRLFELNDGSSIHLNTNSRVSVNYSLGLRQLTLEQGEAHFNVAHDEQRPFVVSAGQQTVTAVGTAFNIRLSQQDDMELLVTEGRVSLANKIDDSATNQPNPTTPTTTTYLDAGQKIAANTLAQSPIEPVASSAIDGKLAWQRGFIVFDGTPLGQALQEVQRYAEYDIVATEDIQNLEIAGFFKTSDIDKLIASLEQSFDLSSERKGQTIYLRQR
ncbi:FecR domain-containing protein [uncultured Pseudoteredinibacter sp.]|uniref:FecR family protein n=1 Tax=uncultured Pseudoteredinibacter sp. TaxID=1641701 RepID=UPI00260D77C4|nr:FecR domain-containing protein [uncultured Pseudoteredinibacter sp.]